MKTNFLKDRFTQGFIAGFVGGLATSAINIPLYWIGVVHIRLVDFAGVLVYGYKPKHFWESLFIFFVHWGFAGFGGILFIYLIKFIKKDNLVFKGLLFGIGIWFTVYIATELFKIEEFRVIPFPTALGNFLASSAYGIVLALLLKYLDKKIRNQRNLTGIRN